ncbi:hypothetical protein HOL63_04125 [Candidatus Peregrinibacteria bacterium]|jgi:hypothetical protein|nr:hypothetical protein [Candidatus Peregrinibacteria bacterium]MBT5468574.1 hypothetical protein [Candidatus Peregrinibacteria bacterium]MBT7337257.1 hypothetical protein [Candidatus Peregrinibacteria bacterium]
MTLFFIQSALAQNTLTVPNSGMTPATVIGNVIDTLGLTIFSLSGAAFLLGAMMYVAGFVNEENKSKGKSLMIGALVGMAVVLASHTIFNSVLFFVYG